MPGSRLPASLSLTPVPCRGHDRRLVLDGRRTSTFEKTSAGSKSAFLTQTDNQKRASLAAVSHVLSLCGGDSQARLATAAELETVEERRCASENKLSSQGVPSGSCLHYALRASEACEGAGCLAWAKPEWRSKRDLRSAIENTTLTLHLDPFPFQLHRLSLQQRQQQAGRQDGIVVVVVVQFAARSLWRDSIIIQPEHLEHRHKRQLGWSSRVAYRRSSLLWRRRARRDRARHHHRLFEVLLPQATASAAQDRPARTRQKG